MHMGLAMSRNSGFHKWGYPKKWIVYNGTSMEHPIKMDDLGVPPFQDTSSPQPFAPAMLRHGTQLAEQGRFVEAAEAFAAAAAAEATPEAFEALAQCGWARG